MAKIIILDDLSDDGLNLLRSAANIEVEIRTGLKGDALKSALAESDGAICRAGVKITAESLAGNQRLRAIARAGVGVDNIDTKAATRQGIVVMNTPGGNTLSTAEQTLALMYGLVRNIAPANQSLVEGRWDQKKFLGTQLAGKTLGIVGLGRIGQAVAAGPSPWRCGSSATIRSSPPPGPRSWASSWLPRRRNCFRWSISSRSTRR